MASGFRLFTKRFLLAINIFIVFLFLLSCLAPYPDPEKWWFISVLGLAFPFLLIAVVLFSIFWLFAKPKFFILSAIALLAGWKSTGRLFALNREHDFIYTKKKDELRIVSWNVARFIELKQNNNKGSQQRLEMMALLKKQNADVLCLQELHTSVSPGYYNNIAYIQKELNYPWFYFSYVPDTKDHWYGSIIFSRIPMIDSGIITYPKPGITEVLMHADLKFNNDTIRVYNTHLQSVLFEKKDYEKIEQIQEGDEHLLQNSKSIVSKLKIASRIRGRQAAAVEKQLADDKYPILLTCDLNDVPTSYPYAKIRGDMQDAFLEKGFGIGRTFSSLSPTLRIDYIFADKNFSIQQFCKYTRNLSDHYMIVADVKLKNGAGKVKL
jgi:endonuclease/exonuclease/phosphatase family metal-dependent hydrolase